MLPRNAVDLLIAYQSHDPLTHVMAAECINERWPKRLEFASALHKANYTASEFGKQMIKDQK